MASQRLNHYFLNGYCDFEAMMQMVPCCSPQPTATSSSSSSNFDFDLDLLPLDCQVPSLELPLPDISCGGGQQQLQQQQQLYYYSYSQQQHQQVPSPTNTLSPLEVNLHSPTMFSPMDHGPQKPTPTQHGLKQDHHRYAQLASPLSMPPTSPYSPLCHRPHRLSSSSSSDAPRSSSFSSLEASLAEFQELQNKVKFEQEHLASPPPYSPPNRGSSSSSTTTTQATVQIKIEPVEHSAETPELKRALADHSFADRYGLKPFDFGVTTGFASCSSSSSAAAACSSSSGSSQFRPSHLSQPPPAYPRELIKHESIGEESADEEQDEQVKMEPVLSLVMEQVKSDISNVCRILNISANPAAWSRSDVSNWLRFTMQQYNIQVNSEQHSAALDRWVDMGGSGFAQLTEQDFKQQFQQGGEHLYAKLDIWRTAAEYQSQQAMHQHHQQQLQQQSKTLPPPPPMQHRPAQKEDSFDISYVLQMLDNKEDQFASTTSSHGEAAANVHPDASPYPASCSSGGPHSQPPTHALSPPPPYRMYEQQQQQPRSVSESRLSISASETDYGSEAMEDEIDEDEAAASPPSSRPQTANPPTPAAGPSGPTASAATGGSGRSSSNIHLWQFVKELLNQPHMYSGCIHWLDRERGIFKIVDSNRVATLWGKRKNRPAMNYDKLSRSLRQYYKKGIMKKTERTQRLVYQFCPPYHL